MVVVAGGLLDTDLTLMHRPIGRHQRLVQPGLWTLFAILDHHHIGILLLRVIAISVRRLHLSHMSPELMMKADLLLGHERGVVVHTTSVGVNQSGPHRSRFRLSLEAVGRLIEPPTSGRTCERVELGSHPVTVVTKGTIAATAHSRSKRLLMVAAPETALLQHLLAH